MLVCVQLNVDPSGAHTDLEVPLEIIIGTIPLRQVVEQYPPRPAPTPAFAGFGPPQAGYPPPAAAPYPGPGTMYPPPAGSAPYTPPDPSAPPMQPIMPSMPSNLRKLVFIVPFSSSFVLFVRCFCSLLIY